MHADMRESVILIFCSGFQGENDHVRAIVCPCFEV